MNQQPNGISEDNSAAPSMPATDADSRNPQPAVKKLWDHILSKLKPSRKLAIEEKELKETLKSLDIGNHALETKLAWQRLQQTKAPIEREEEIALLKIRLADERQDKRKRAEELKQEHYEAHQDTVQRIQAEHAQRMVELDEDLRTDQEIARLDASSVRQKQEMQDLKLRIKVAEEEKLASQSRKLADLEKLEKLRMEGADLRATITGIDGAFDEAVEKMRSLEVRLENVTDQYARAGIKIAEMEGEVDDTEATKLALRKLIEK
ncbi:hypothetical protein HDU76_010778, partial [Blyttiomyces sp. JEL0837]